MKVLFAIRDDNNIVDSIARKYQRDYNKKLLYKEVKNFTAILRELQQNNSYDRIVISDNIDEKINKSENKNKLILSRLNSIRKAAINKNNKSIPIIFISNNDKIKKQLFDLNIYNGILSEDKIKRKLYELMQKPRNSKKAKEYYNIQETPKAQGVQKTVSKSVDKQSNEKSEVEKVINYLNQTGLSDEKYVKKFERAYSTLSKSDLDILIKSLSARTKKILSNNSTRYNKIVDTKKANKALNSKKTVNNEVTETTEETTTKRGRGRPRKQPKEDELEEEPVVKRKRGRPRKVSLEEEQTIKKENQKEEQSKNVNKKPEKTINKTQKVSTKLEKAVNKTEEVDDKPEKVTNKAEKVAVPNKKQNKVSKKEKKYDKLDDLEDDDFELEEDLESTDATNNELKNDNLDALEDDDLDDDFFDDEEENNDDKDNREDDDDLDLDEEDDGDNDKNENEDDDDYDDLDLDEDDDDYDNLDLDEDENDYDDLDSNEEDDDNHDDLDLDEDDNEHDDIDSDEEEDDYDDLDLDEDDDEHDDLDSDEEEDDYDDLDLDEDDDDDYDDLDEDNDDDLDLDKDNKKENLDLNENNNEEDGEFDPDDYDDLDLEDDDLDLNDDNNNNLNLDQNDQKQEDEEDDDDYLDLDDEDDDLSWDEDDDEDDNNLNLDNQQDNNVNTVKNEEEEDDLNLDDDDDYLDLDDEEDNSLNSYNNNNNENKDLNIDDEDDDLNLDKYDDEDDNNEFTVDEDDDLDFQNTNTNNNSDDELSLDDDELKIDDNKNIGNTSNQFSGIRNKNYIPNYDISKQINEINSVSNNKTLNNNEEKDGNSVSVSIPEGKNIAAFVGAHGNGTSFIVNNLAQLLSEQGIKVAILDLTKNKNAYYIYTENEERLRGIAYSCFEKLKSGISDGIKVNKNLTVYTSLPNSDSELENKESAIKTLLNEFSLILLDCDLETDLEYFEIAQEIYLVQTLDVLTIQPLTSFMKKLKMNNKLNEGKLRVLINKDIKVNKLNEKILISAMSVYNSPDTTYQLDLFNRDKIGYLTIPFEERNYSKYLDELVECKLTIRGYSKSLINSFNKLAKIVYPMNNKKRK